LVAIHGLSDHVQVSKAVVVIAINGLATIAT